MFRVSCLYSYSRFHVFADKLEYEAKSCTNTGYGFMLQPILSSYIKIEAAECEINTPEELLMKPYEKCWFRVCYVSYLLRDLEKVTSNHEILELESQNDI